MRPTTRPLSGGRRVSSPVRLFFTSAVSLAMAAGAVLHAQQSNGTITGLVTDGKNGAVPGARVTVSSNDGTFKTETATSSSGIYTVPSLLETTPSTSRSRALRSRPSSRSLSPSAASPPSTPPSWSAAPARPSP